MNHQLEVCTVPVWPQWWTAPLCSSFQVFSSKTSIHESCPRDQGLQVQYLRETKPRGLPFLFASWIRYLFEKQDLESENNPIPVHSDAWSLPQDRLKGSNDHHLQHNTDSSNKKFCFKQNSMIAHSSDLIFDVLNEEHGSYKQLLQTSQLVNP